MLHMNLNQLQESRNIKFSKSIDSNALVLNSSDNKRYLHCNCCAKMQTSVISSLPNVEFKRLTKLADYSKIRMTRKKKNLPTKKKHKQSTLLKRPFRNPTKHKY